MPLVIDQTNSETIPARSTTIDPSLERVLLAFSNKDRGQFFPNYRDGFPGEGKRTWVDTSTFSSVDVWSDYLKELRPTIMVSCWSTPPLPTSLVLDDSFPLRYLCHVTGTVRTKVPREFIAAGGLVTNWGNTISHNVAEHALLLILSSLRNFTTWRRSMKESSHAIWGNGPSMKTRSLRGRKVGIHGFGNVAKELVRLLAPFDVQIRSFCPTIPSAHMQQKGVIPCGSLEELFSKSDVVVECEALTNDTAGSVNERILRLMPEGGLFVNVARGALVDEKALQRVVAEGRIHAALDVFEAEPLPEDSPLFDLDNTILSPHIAGPTGDWFPRCGDFALDNLDRYLEGQSVNGIVSLEVYDRCT